MKRIFEVAFAILTAMLELNLMAAKPAVAERTAQIFSVSFGNRYTDSDFRNMAEKLDLLIIDELNYPQVPGVIRETNPHIKVFGYCNTFDIRDMSDYEGRSLIPGGKTDRMMREWHEADDRDWFYRDEQGRRVKVYLNKTDRRYGLDIGKPEVREFLAAKARDIVARGYDGVFLDNVGVRYPYGYGVGKWVSAVPNGLTERKWWEGSILMLRAIKQAVGDKIVFFNQVRGYNPDVSFEFIAETDGAMDESWLSDGNFKAQQWCEDVTLIKRINQIDKYTLPIAQGTSKEAAMTLFASYLLAKDGDHAYFSYGPYNFTQWKWFSFYDVNLGQPVENSYTSDGNVYQRRYERGIVLVNISNEPQTLTLPVQYQTRTGEKVTSIKLSEHNGRLLYKPDEKGKERVQ